MSDRGPVLAAEGVLKRLLGDRASEFHLSLDSVNGTCDSFSLEAESGTVSIRGNSAVALCRGAYHYLKHAAHCQVSWSGDAPRLPEVLPSFPKAEISSPCRYRYYFSVCTFGYSSVWWDWERWEREIDWMALHGINMPLALNGQEKIWQRVFRELGLEDEDILAHFSGPAYLPWHRLGNLNGHMGPLPQSWIDEQAELQKLILNRERELGMSPVVPGFSGFVPSGFSKICPDVDLQSATPWAGFPPTTFVDPCHPRFVEIGRRFIREYHREFGRVHHYLCETFAEQNPRFEPETEASSLRALGNATWQSLSVEDPDAVWVMQGWPFFYARDYWTPERAAALFEDVPENRLIVLDLTAETFEAWREQPTMREKGWIFNVLHNYGQNTHLHGDLQAYADRAWNALNDPEHGNMQGMGIVPEGIDQNPVVYELATDWMWTNERIDVSEWIVGYIHSRYGAVPDSAREAWRLLLDAVYGPERPPVLRWSWRFRPGDQPPVATYDIDKVRLATLLLFGSAGELGWNSNYRRDLVDVAKTWLGCLADLYLEAALSGEADSDEYQSRFLEILKDLDRLVGTRSEHRLSGWIKAAQKWAHSEGERALYERNGRSLVTVWGGPYLFDYANREWAGLIKDFQIGRWRYYFEATESGNGSPELAEWEQDWANSRQDLAESEEEDSVQVVGELLAKYGDEQVPLANDCRIIQSPKLEMLYKAGAAGWFEIELERERSVCGIMVFPMFGQGCVCRYACDISKDGENWAPVDEVKEHAPATRRGYRKSFAAIPAQYARVSVERLDHGEVEQLYKVHLFEPNPE